MQSIYHLPFESAVVGDIFESAVVVHSAKSLKYVLYSPGQKVLLHE